MAIRSWLCLCLVGLASLSLVSADIKLQQVDRKINLASQFAKVTEAIKVKNTGSIAVGSISLCYQVQPGAVLAYIKVLETQPEKVELKVSQTSVPDAPSGVSCFQANLASPLPAGESTSLTTTVVFANAQKPFPAEITQQETQLVLYVDNVYVLSPYQVSAQTTEVTLASSTIKSFTEEKPSSKSGSKVTYGKYDLIKPFTVKELRLHYENQKPFKTVTTCVREIEVSHWGNIYVEEKYELKNAGSKHTGAFSRLKYAHSYNGKANSFRDMKARLPASARSLYYVDLIGNISSSNTRKGITETVLDFDLRYPLMGTWKVDFTLGYSVPLSGFLFKKKSDGKLRLTMDLLSPLEDVYIEDLVVRVVLPEGASALSAVLPHEIEQSFDTKYTYLDTTGRPVLVLHKQHLVPEHAAKFSVDYSFASISVLREPLLLIAVFFALLAGVIAYNRMEFTISRDDKWQEAQSREKLATIMEQIYTILQDEDDVAASYVPLIGAVREAADVDNAQRERSNIDKRIKELDDKMRPLVASVEASGGKLAAGVKEVVDKVKGLQTRYAKQLGERLDLIKKGSSAQEVVRKLGGTQQILIDARKEVAAAVDTMFGNY